MNSQAPKIALETRLDDDDKLYEENPFSQLICSCISYAKQKDASDIHFEPYMNEFLIRVRILGQLVDWNILDHHYAAPVISKLKWILNMDLAVVGAPQDSRASFTSLKLDVRASSMPVLGGKEKIVLRLQNQDHNYNFEHLGLESRVKEALLENATKKEGLILISGPTGSGKTTTMYSLLNLMDKRGKNISTLENPIEKNLPRINQAHLNDYKSFGDFQRALMRQDPDIILIGEIRDEESASMCIKMSMTGHLVLSTIHANGAIEVVERLKKLGIDELSIVSNLRMSAAQRLVQLICPKCSGDAPSRLIKSLQNELKKFGDVHRLKIKNPRGCENCYSGVVGRKVILEFLKRNQIKEIVLGAKSSKGFLSLRSEALALAARGQVDINEAISFGE